jgi:lysophospholipase L1-like esterase
MPLHLVALGDSTLDSGRYSGGAGTSPPEILAETLGLTLHHLARDGHTAKAVADFQIPRLPAPGRETVLVLSVGGNDVLYALAASRTDETRLFERGLDAVLSRARKHLRPLRTLVANIYDPSGHDPGFERWITDLDRALEIHARFNEVVARVAATHEATLVDLCAEFRATAGCSPPWIANRIEPSAEGARQIARLLGEALLAG